MIGVCNNLPGFKRFFISLLFFIVLISLIWVLSQFWSFTSEVIVKYEKVKLRNIRNLPECKLNEKDFVGLPRNAKCSHWDCFDIYKCGRTGHDRITVFVYPPYKYVDENNDPATDIMSKQYFTILQSIIDSKYYTANAKEACLFVPSIDTLNQDRLNINLTSKALHKLPQ